MKHKVLTIEDLKEVTAEIISKLNDFRIFCFDGDLGAGKTTLIKSLGIAIGIKDDISSPTFSIVNEYRDRDSFPVYHFDFYRLKDEEEAFDIGIEEYLYSNNICLIEWANMFPGLIPPKHLEINIKLVDEKYREITLIEHD